MATLPQFAAGELSKIQPAIDSGVLKYPAYVFVRDENKLAFIDSDNEMHLIVGDNKKQVVRVEELPAVEDADDETFYICAGIVYILENNELKSVFQDYSSQLTQINDSLRDLTTRVGECEKGKNAIAFSTKSTFPETGEENLLYVATDEPAIYVWNVETAQYLPMNSDDTNSLQWIEL